MVLLRLAGLVTATFALTSRQNCDGKISKQRSQNIEKTFFKPSLIFPVYLR